MPRSIAAQIAVVLLAGTLFLTVAVKGQATWYVDDDAPADPGPGDPTISDPDEDGSADHPFDAIQEAINAAVNGDTVLVEDGIYTGAGNRDLDLGGRLIAVRSENGPDTCIIDCEHAGRGFFFGAGDGALSILIGLTIRNGRATSDSPGGSCGGAVYCNNCSNLMLRNCAIINNKADRGGGIYCRQSSPTLADCTISGNKARYQGGGLYCLHESSPMLIGCTIDANVSLEWGGGVSCFYYSHPILANCEISNNGANYGGGVDCDDSDPVLVNCRITANSAESGGGVRCYGSNSTIVDCVIKGNMAGSGGGVVYYHYSNLALVNCTITANTAGRRGGGVYGSSEATLTNCTISDNVANTGGGMWSGYIGSTLTNCILWRNQPQQICVYSSGSPIVTYSAVQGGWSGDGNIDADPLFVDPDGPDDDPDTWEDNNYHLAAGSPCVDAGDNTAVPPGVRSDLDGNPRFVDDAGMPDDGLGTAPIVDMGTYEFQGETCFGDLDGDYDVDLADLATLLPHCGHTETVYTDGDLDRDEDVDSADLAALLAVYGMTCE